jgi:hypothetical protein
MTPARMLGLECPSCHATEWTWHNDHTGLPGGDQRLNPGERFGRCARCGSDMIVREQSPVHFFFQPDANHPMDAAEFAYWVAILKQQFPDHLKLKQLGTTWYPGYPGVIGGTISLVNWWSWWLLVPQWLNRKFRGARAFLRSAFGIEP